MTGEFGEGVAVEVIVPELPVASNNEEIICEIPGCAVEELSGPVLVEVTNPVWLPELLKALGNIDDRDSVWEETL